MPDRATTVRQFGLLTLINPVPRAEAFDHPDWVFEAKFDGFRAAADTVRGQTDLAQLQPDAALRGGVLDLLPKGDVFDGELVVLFSEESTPNADRH